MALLDQHVDHIIVHTGQNYDYELMRYSGKNWSCANLIIFLMSIPHPLVLLWEILSRNPKKSSSRKNQMLFWF
jgi:hypothetical protein